MMAGFDSFGAARFLPDGIPEYGGEMQAPSPQLPAQGQAFQPNYDLFFNPYTMLQMGQPSFGSPWYTSVQVPEIVPPGPDITQSAPVNPWQQAQPGGIMDRIGVSTYTPDQLLSMYGGGRRQAY